MANFSLFLKCVFALYISLPGLKCQQDCTNSNCPPLENCIEEVLETGACCASCLQKGCTCEGYQYYDCLNAGFKHGKVPEGDSYFVDYGSTECSCPVGGGRISCHFISCPEMPPNCIEVSEPVDGCLQCERIGCIHDGQKFEAGHSFHINSCHVCHCPNEGGKPMCYPVPDCDPEQINEPAIAVPPLDEPGLNLNNYPYIFDQKFPTPDHPAPEGNLPLFKAPIPDNEDPEDYDYGPTDFPGTFPHSLAFATDSASFNKGSDLVSQNEEQISKLELKEHFGVLNYPTERPPFAEESTVPPQYFEEVTSSWKLLRSPAIVDLADFKYLLNAEHGHFGSFVLPLKTDQESEEVQPEQRSDNSVHIQEILESQGSLGASLGNQINTSQSHNNRHNSLNGQHPPQQKSTMKSSLQSTDLIPTLEPEGLPKEEDYDEGKNIVPLQNGTFNVKQDDSNTEFHNKKVTPTYREVPLQSTTTYQSTTPAYITPSAEPRSLLKQNQPKTLQKASDTTREQEGPRKTPTDGATDQFGLHRRAEGGEDDDLVQRCCVAGQKWAAQNDHCVDMPFLIQDKTSVCSIAQKQCCLSSVREAHCESGLTAARAGSPCGVDQETQCPDDTYQVCCSCCALGLRVRQEGLSCDNHLSLGYPCGHIFLTCCEEEPGPSHNLLWSKHKPRSTARPRQVLVSPVPRQALSISATEDTANVRLDEDDVEHCQAYAGQLCQHTCTNTWGSYRCGCHLGYSLQPDGHSCAPESPDEDSSLTEDVGHFETSTSKATTSSSPVYVSPCEDKRCSQQCSVIGGKALCSCLSGFSLMTDGRTCRDVDECSSVSHSCRSGQRCRNTVGSFVCERVPTCAPGHRLSNGRCEDIDECVLMSHNCGSTFSCENTPGSFRCRPKVKCIAGFTQDSHGNCIDINECSVRSDPCGPASRCINTVGSYSCQKKSITCSRGYHANAQGDACVDVDECQVGSHRCGVGQICQNLPGSYRCECQTGYQYDALHKVCNDVNECWRFTGRLCSQTCENTPGSYHCSCTSGFFLGPDGKTCEDVNECEKHPCSQECANIFGSYQCYCRQGYYLKEDGHTCEDIDECSQSMGNLCAFQCVNVIGSYQCACPPDGYVMAANGRTCKDVDECATGAHNCSIGQSCYNLQGGFRCLSFDCPHNYNKVTDTRCERVSCPSNSLECQNSPVRITYYQLSFQTNIIVPAQIFRISPSPAYSGDHIVIRITEGNEEGYFSTRKLNSHTGAVYLNRQVREPRDFLVNVEMRLLRQGTFTSFLARIYVFITSSHM